MTAVVISTGEYIRSKGGRTVEFNVVLDIIPTGALPYSSTICPTIKLTIERVPVRFYGG